MNFTQFKYPNGDRIPTSIGMPAEVEGLAAELIAAKWSFEIEVLRNGLVNMDCCDEETALNVVVCANGPEVMAAVESLVRGAHKTWEVKGKPQAVGDRRGDAERYWKREWS